MAKFNLNLSDSAYAELDQTAARLDNSMADVVRGALSLSGWITGEICDGNRLLIQRGERITEVVVPDLEMLREPRRPTRATLVKHDLS